MQSFKTFATWTVALAFGTFAVTVFVVYACNNLVAPKLPTSERLLSGDTLRVPSRINQQTAGEFLDVLSKHRGEIERIEAKGYGGEAEAAATIAEAIRSTGLKPVVPDGTGCVSVCVGVLVESGSTDVADQGYVLFHAGRITARNDASACVVCRLASNALDAIVGPLTPPSTVGAMQIWAKAFSPALPAFFDSCTINPLSTEEGMALSGAQLKAISAGNSPSCNALSKQSFTWLKDFLRK
ncbi:hypothetical protein [Ensifer sp. NM-2]|uniref:hypothetical protein n=1 Tax=Ensifer sp. NM-2 TaxID=2109730 RepID=UPI0011B25C29|nr:hypothetical protein [Ensifer sp. NM-2]